MKEISENQTTVLTEVTQLDMVVSCEMEDLHDHKCGVIQGVQVSCYEGRCCSQYGYCGGKETGHCSDAQTSFTGMCHGRQCSSGNALMPLANFAADLKPSTASGRVGEFGATVVMLLVAGGVGAVV